MQGDFSRNYPSLQIQILGINDFNFPNGNDSITEGRSLPWVEDVDDNGDGQPDTWVEWDIVYRDVAIVDRAGEMVETFNLTQFNLADADNLEALKQLFISTAATPPSSAFESPVERLDVDANGVIAPIDALLVINELNVHPGGVIPQSYANQAPYVDTVNGDGIVAPLDALAVINQLNFISELNSGSATPAAALHASTTTIETSELAVPSHPLAASSSSSSSSNPSNVIDHVFAERYDEDHYNEERVDHAEGVGPVTRFR